MALHGEVHVLIQFPISSLSCSPWRSSWLWLSVAAHGHGDILHAFYDFLSHSLHQVHHCNGSRGIIAHGCQKALHPVVCHAAVVNQQVRIAQRD